jgi:hypothetical protein
LVSALVRSERGADDGRRDVLAAIERQCARVADQSLTRRRPVIVLATVCRGWREAGGDVEVATQKAPEMWNTTGISRKRIYKRG